MMYHVCVTPTTGRPEILLDLSGEELARRFLESRLEARPITIGGRSLAWGEISRLQVYASTQTSLQLIPVLRAKYAGKQWASGLSDAELVIDGSEDVTEQHVTEAVGARRLADVLAAGSPWFHALLTSGVLRQASEFNLREDELLRRFVEPWRRGDQVLADGKAFNPSSSKLRIYAGVRMTKSQLSFGQGGLNASKFCEDVTQELLSGEYKLEPDAESAATPPRRDPRAVAVFHGRDEQARQAMFGLLRDLDLRPLGWEELVAATGQTDPYTGDVVRVAFELAQAIVVLFTPDDEARLHADLAAADDAGEKILRSQARSNVILEAGMALMSHPGHTIIVEIGRLRPISNLGGRNTVRLGRSNLASALNAIRSRLETAHCPVNDKDAGWLNAERFETLAALDRRAHQSTVSTTTAPTNAAPPVVSSSSKAVEDDLKALVRVAADDLLDRDDEPPDDAVRDWASRADVTIRHHCRSPYDSVFRACGRGQMPRDEVRSKIAYLLDELVPAARRGEFLSPAP